MKSKVSIQTSLLVVFLLFFTACTEKTHDAELHSLNRELQNSVAQIESAKEIAKRRKQAEQLILKIYDYLEESPDAKDASEWAFRNAELHFTELQETRKAVGLLEAVQRQYPDTEAGAKALFLAAYLHLNELNNPEVAQNLYIKFVDTYPDHTFAKDARLELQYIGKSPEEILKSNLK
jgi:tetratricopeptide (TPR) repeat protein